MNYILLIVGFILLIKGSDYFIEGSSNIAKYFKIPSVVIGLTLVAFGTSAPEAAVSINAALKNSPDLSISNIIGSNIFNLFMILGLTAIIKDIIVEKELIKKDYLFSILSSIILFTLIIINYSYKKILLLTRINGLILIIILFLYLSKLLKNINFKNHQVEQKQLSIIDILFTIGGLILIIFGGKLTVISAISIARLLGLSERLIGLTIIAIGTSLPELITSLVALIKGKKEIAVGNIIGSNIFNILFILGLTSIISPMLINLESLIDLSILIMGSLVIYFLFSDLKISRLEGLSMVLLYLLYCFYIIMR